MRRCCSRVASTARCGCPTRPGARPIYSRLSPRSPRSSEGANVIEVTLVEGVLRLRIDRPGKRNAIDDEMMATLLREVEKAGSDERVRVIVLEGAGEDFCSGFDIVGRNAGDRRPRAGSIQRRLPTQAHRLIPLVTTVQVPVVCKVHGWAAGIGFQLALAADFCIAADDARFWQPFIERGFTPDSGATWLLPRRVGDARA